MSDIFESLSLENLTFTEIAIGIVIICAILAFFRGVLRQILGMICLLIGAASGFYIFKSYGEHLAPHFGETSARTVLMVSILGGLVIYGLLRLLVNMLLGTALFVAFAGLFGNIRQIDVVFIVDGAYPDQQAFNLYFFTDHLGGD